MGTLEVFVGLNYHQSAVQVCVLSRDGQMLANRSCPNDSVVIANWVHQFGNRVHAAIESCCGAADLGEELIAGWGWSLDLAHPGFVGRMKQNPDKSDYSDARLLADLERVGYLPRVWLAPEEVRELRRLVRYRQQLAQERRNLKLRLGAMLREQRIAKADATPWTKKWLHWLQRQAPLSEVSRWIVAQQLERLQRVEADIVAVEEQLAQQTAEDRIVQELLQQKGVGLVTAVTIRAEIGRFDRFRTGKQLARFCGLSPRNASSGERQADAGLIKAGNPQLRGVLIELAHRLVRYEPRWRALAASLRAKGKAGSVVAAAIANRWMRGLHHRMQPAVLAA